MKVKVINPGCLAHENTYSCCTVAKDDICEAIDNSESNSLFPFEVFVPDQDKFPSFTCPMRYEDIEIIEE